jgi:hypothetical protein
MNITRRQLKAQFDRVVRLGWLPFFEEAANTITKGYYDAADLIGIGSRETNLDPKWLKKPGDGGMAGGLMQADKRSFPDFIASGQWKDARQSILFGARVLMLKQRDYEATIGKSVKIKGSSYTGKAASGQIAQHIVISSYNCGRWSQFCYAKGLPIDKYSTGHDYGEDVMQRAAVIRSFLKNSAAESSKPEGLSIIPDNLEAGIQANGQQPTRGEQSPVSANVAVEKEVELGFFAKIKLKLSVWLATIGGLTGISQYKQQIDDLGLPGWVALYAVSGAILLFFGWLIYEAAKHLLEWYQKRKRTDVLVNANANTPGTVVIACPEDLGAFERAGWTVVRRQNVVPPVPEIPTENPN